MWRRAFLLVVVLLVGGTTRAWAQITVDGIIHQSDSLDPVSGVALFVVDAETGAVLPPTAFEFPQEQGQITGSDGRYRFTVQAEDVVRVSLERLDANFSFPSTRQPPEGGSPFGRVACDVVQCPNGQLTVEPAPTGNTPYALLFNPSSPDRASNNHIPIDRLDGLLDLSMVVDRQRVEVGGRLAFSVTATQASIETLNDVRWQLSLPPGLRAAPEGIAARIVSGNGQARAANFDGDAVAIGAWAPGEVLRVSGILRVTEAAKTERRLRIRSWLERGAGVRVSREVLAELALTVDQTLGLSTIIGQVYCEDPAGRAGWVDANERGLPGARVVLDTGFEAITDVQGRFHFTGVPPGTRYAKLDQRSLPPKSQAPAIGRQMYISPGTPQKVRFPVQCVFDEWRPTEVFAGSNTPQGPVLPRTMQLVVDPTEHSVKLADRHFDFMRGELQLARARGILKLFPAAVGGPSPERWRVRVQRVGKAGPSLEIKDARLLGRGLPPVFIELPVDKNGAYRARLELSAEDLDSTHTAWVEAPVAVAAAGPSRMMTTLAAEPSDELAKAARDLVSQLQTELQTPGRLIRVEAHWDAAAEDPRARALELAHRLIDQWVKAGLPKSRLVAVSRGAESPKAPSLSRRMRLQNRRVDVVAASVRPVAQMPWSETATAAALKITADARTASVPVSNQPIAISLELDPPAKVVFELTNTEGAMYRMHRVVTQGRVLRTQDRLPLPVVPSADAVAVGQSRFVWPKLSVSGALQTGTEGWVMSVDLRAPEQVEQWRVLWLDSSARVLANASGQGDVPPRLELKTEDPAVAQGSQVVVEMSLDATRRLRATTLNAPPLAAPTGVVRVRPDSGSADPLSGLEVFLSSAEPGIKVVRLHGGGRNRRTLKQALQKRGAFVEAGRERGELEFEAFRRGQAVLQLAPVATRTSTTTRGRQIFSAVAPDRTLRVALPILEEAPLQKEPPPPTPPEDQIKASRLRITGPSTDEALQGDRLVAVGQANPSDRVEVNGRAVDLAEDGRFLIDVALDPGVNDIEVVAEDAEGGRAVIRRQVTSSSTSWFLLALGEGRLTTGGAQLAGDGKTAFTEAGPVGLYGRATVLGDARTAWQGRRLVLKGRLDTSEFSGNVQVLRLEDDPFRLLPALGDAATERQLTSSRRGVDISLRLDDSQIEAGDRARSYSLFETDPLFEARLAGFGAFADVSESVTDNDETWVRGGATFASSGVVRSRDELLATGGALYWLSRRDLVEGSERVRLVIRDRDTGFTLQEKLLERGKDYRIRPREGRLVMAEPVASHSGVAGAPAASLYGLAGHPVSIVVDYSAVASGVRETNYAALLTETLFEQFEISGGVAGTEAPTDSHRIFGLGAAWRPTERSFVEFEWARSEGQTDFGRLSTDGGLAFVELNRVTPAERNAAQAFGLKAMFDMQDVMQKRGYLRMTGRTSGLGFSSVGAARAAGRLEGEVAAGLEVTPGLMLQLRAAAARTDIQGVLELLRTTQALFSASADYRQEDWAAGFDVVHQRTNSEIASGNLTSFVARYERELTEDLTLRAAQQVGLGSTPLSPRGAGRFATSLGLSYALHERLTADAWQTVRYNGDNSSQLGLRFTDPDGMSVYVAERLGTTAGSTQLSTVVGAEESRGGSRSYAELQFAGALNPNDARAILGMEHRFSPIEDWQFSVAYERVQLTAQAGAVPTPASPWAGPLGGLSTTLGGFGTTVQLLPEAVSRDALSAGFGYRPHKKLRFDLRGEMRLDHAPAIGADYLSLGLVGGGAFVITEGLSLVGRLDVHHVQDRLQSRVMARAVEGSLSAVYRPPSEDWFTLVLRYTKLMTQRPSTLFGERPSENRDALSVEPIIDTPWNVRLLERVALVKTKLALEGLEDDELSILWINRVEAELPYRFDLGIEYRMLAALESDTVQRGFLGELGWLPQDNVRLGVGYNFSSFSDDVLVLASEDAAGPFFRVTARY